MYLRNKEDIDDFSENNFRRSVRVETILQVEERVGGEEVEIASIEYLFLKLGHERKDD